ncbi:MAG: hypothetical protein V5A39_00110 [Haloarculaceae archaeon]
MFLNSVTPFGQASGDPPSGLLVARTTGATFEDSLAYRGAAFWLPTVAGGVVTATLLLAGD